MSPQHPARVAAAPVAPVARIWSASRRRADPRQARLRARAGAALPQAALEPTRSTAVRRIRLTATPKLVTTP